MTEPNTIMKWENIYNPGFKSKVVPELLSGQQTLHELSGKYQISPVTSSCLYKQFQERAADFLRCGKTVSFH